MIHVFNGTGSALSMVLNSGPVPSPERTDPEGYRPFSRLYELKKLCENGFFHPGRNSLDVQYRDFKPPQPTSAQFTIHVPDCASIQSDFVLFLLVNGAILMRPSGEIVDNQFHPITTAKN